MFSKQYQNSYQFLSAAVMAYRNSTDEMRRNVDTSAVAAAFQNATFGMSPEDQRRFVHFALQLLKQPGEFERKKKWRSHTAPELGRETTDNTLVRRYSFDLVIADEFIARAMITESILAEKVREHRIFKLVDWACDFPIFGEELYPAFFADPRYPISALECVSMTMAASSGERRYRFFTTPNSLLAYQSPLEALANGQVQRVINAAKTFMPICVSST